MAGDSGTDLDRLERRLSAVERVVVDGDRDVAELAALDSLVETVETIEGHVGDHERRLAELEAAVESIEGYVGSVESVNEDVERRAAAAVATADRLDGRLERLEAELEDLQGGILDGADPGAQDERGSSETEDGRADPGTEDGRADPGTEDGRADPGTETEDDDGRSAIGDDGVGSAIEDDGPPRRGDSFPGTETADSFEFGRVEEGPTPERVAAELLGDQSDPDGSGIGSADQRAVETSLGGDGTVRAGASDGDTTSEGDDDRSGGGLLAALRSRLP